MENFSAAEPMDMRYHNTNGYLHVSKIPYETKIADAFVKGSMERGFDYVDYNGATQVRFTIVMRKNLRFLEVTQVCIDVYTFSRRHSVLI